MEEKVKLLELKITLIEEKLNCQKSITNLYKGIANGAYDKSYEKQVFEYERDIKKIDEYLNLL